jgi:hypothetical protein
MKTHIVIVVDRSGPPNGLVQASFVAVNTFIDSLRENKDILSVTINQFDDEFDQLCEQVSPSEVPELTLDAAFIPSQITPLFDAIGNSMSNMGAKKNVLMIVVSNKLDNHSQEFDSDSIKVAVEEKTKTGWSFVFTSSDLLMVSNSAYYKFNVGVNPQERYFAATSRGFSKLTNICETSLTEYLTSDVDDYDVVDDIVTAVIDDNIDDDA